MYSETVSLTEDIQDGSAESNVLQTYPNVVGREVVQSVLRPLCEQVERQSEEPSPLTTPVQVEWTMQVVGYGFTLPLQDRALIAQCISVYENWLSALSTDKKSIPSPVRAQPDRYAQIIFEQFCDLFVPRTRLMEGLYLEEHVVLCKRVTKVTQAIIRNKSVSLSRDAWNALILYLLRVSDMLLSPPVTPSSLGSMLCENLVGVLFEAWLRSCTDCFPAPNLWKSLRELCCKWRHHRSLVEQWNRLMYALTYHVISLLYTPKYLLGLTSLPEQELYYRQLLTDMSNDALIQCWFRMLHTLGNPVELAYPSRIAALPAYQKALSEAVKPPQHLSTFNYCFSDLPGIFLECMRGVSTLVYLFLGQDLPKEEPMPAEGSLPSTPHPSPGVRRRDSREGKEGRTSGGIPLVSSTSKLKAATKWYVSTPPLSHQPSPVSQSTVGLVAGLTGDVGRPRGNTLLHLLGSWLFEAAIWPLHALPAEAEGNLAGPRAMLTELSVHTRSVLNPWDFEAGRAEAFGALCSIFSSQPCGEPFLPTYLARFYHAMAVGLHCDPETCRGQALVRIILDSSSLLRKDLQGINILVPLYLSALEIILPCDVLPFECPGDVKELRRASIQLLLSITPLPLHFLHQQLPDLRPILPDLITPSPPNFLSLRDRLLSLTFSALKHEGDPTNVQMLLHGLLVFIQDIVTYENSVTSMLELEQVDREDVDDLHVPLTATRSDGSAYSQGLYSAMGKDYNPPELLTRAITAAHHCLKIWEGNVQVSLAALELMAGLAQLRIENANHNDYRQAVLWVCEYIERQAVKDRPQHSRDLHTSIVAAFHTLTVWITAYYPYLLGTERCLTAIMKVAEMGISGSFSMLEDGSTVYKGDKEPKPISGRVKEIAELVLDTVMEKIGSFPSPCGAEAMSSLLSEKEILAQLPPSKRESQFRYFVADNSLIVGFLEEPFTEGEDTLPTLTVVIRGPSGRHVWSMQLRHQPHSEQPSTQHLQSMPRPLPTQHTPILPTLSRSPWPNDVDKEPRMRVDESIPKLSEIVRDATQPSHHLVAQLTTQQEEAESSVHRDLQAVVSELPLPDPSTALEPPMVKRKFETARLFLSHLGLLGMESIKSLSPAQVSPLARLDSTPPGFRNSLASLDRMPTRFCDTVFVLFLREGVSQPQDILSHQHSLDNKPPEFIEFLHGLGWTVDPLTHPGFLGKIRPRSSDDAVGQAVGIQAENPLRPFPYFTDAVTEVAFVSPVLKASGSDSSASLRSGGSSDSAQDLTASIQGDHTPSLPTHHSLQTLREPQGSGVCESTAQADGDKYTTFPTRGRAGTSSRTDMYGLDTPRKRLPNPQDCAAMVVWLERFEDHRAFPVQGMSAVLHGESLGGAKTITRKALPTIFIHKLASGLYQIVTQSPMGRQEVGAGPLISGMVVSRRGLSALVRQTAINMCSRHRMENDGYSPPHVRRKKRVEEISKEFAKRLSVAEFYSELFVPCRQHASK